MKSRVFQLGLTAIALALLVAPHVHGTTVLSLNLDELSARAAGIFRGRVVDVRMGSVEAGGGTLATTIYRLQVDEAFKGRYARSTKTGEPIVEIQMLEGPAESAKSAGAVRVLPLIAGMPRLQVGQEYLLFTTAPSRIGLSTTVGLGQGCFRIYRPLRSEPVAVNAVDNERLSRAMNTNLPDRGAAPYAELAREIRAALARQVRTR